MSLNDSFRHVLKCIVSNYLFTFFATSDYDQVFRYRQEYMPALNRVIPFFFSGVLGIHRVSYSYMAGLDCPSLIEIGKLLKQQLKTLLVQFGLR